MTFEKPYTGVLFAQTLLLYSLFVKQQKQQLKTSLKGEKLEFTVCQMWLPSIKQGL